MRRDCPLPEEGGVPELMNVSGHAPGSVADDGHYTLNLTGPGSHVLVVEPGRGVAVIGPASLGKRADLHVVPDAAIHWVAFNPFATPAGSPWPRNIDYHGNDTSFFAWSQQRVIEQFRWTPVFADRRSVDASAARIQTLVIRLEHVSGHLSIVVPAAGSLYLEGDLSRIAVGGHGPAMLSLQPALGRRPGQAPYELPALDFLQNVTSLALVGVPLGQAISLLGIERFSSLKSLSLSGSFTDWASLAMLQHLSNLELRFVPDLQDFPALESWPLLDRMIVWNVDEAAGKRLKAQIGARAKVRAWAGHALVSKLRKPAWWQSEYGRPFAGWTSRQAKAANTAYDRAREALEDAADVAAVQAAVVAFSKQFNAMKGIETTQREDVGEAVWQLSQLARVVALGLGEAQLQQWFDEVRDY